jgi:hypothetical protein
MLSTDLASLFERDLLRFVQELRAFPDTTALWQTAPGVTNPAGTLALHIEGNLREYVGRQLGRIEYTRNRPLEFAARDLAHDEIVARVEAVQPVVPRIIEALSDETLRADFPEQYNGASISTQQFLMHLYAHLNYHLGQLDYLRRVTTGHGAIELANLSTRATR